MFIFFITLLVLTFILTHTIRKSQFILPKFLNPIFYLLFGFYTSFYLHLLLPFDFPYNEHSDYDLIVFLQLTLVALISAFIGLQLGKKLIFSRKNLQIDFIKDKSILLLLFIYILSLVVDTHAIISGLAGYQIFDETLDVKSNIFLKLFSHTKSIIFYILSSFYFFSPRHKIKKIILILFLFHLLLSMLSGFKGAIFSMLVLFFILDYIKNRRIDFTKLSISILFMISVFFFIEGYRVFKRFDNSLGMLDFIQIVDVSTFKSEASLYILHKYIERNNLLTSSSIGIAYYPNLSNDKEAPDFLTKIIISPILAFVPRSIWHNKPINIDGLWYNNSVIGSPHTSFTPLGKIIYLYYSGNVIMIFIGYFFIGFFLHYISSFLTFGNYFSVAKYLYFLFLTCNNEMSYDYYLINLFYSLVIFKFLYYIIKISPITERQNIRNDED